MPEEPSTMTPPIITVPGVTPPNAGTIPLLPHGGLGPAQPPLTTPPSYPVHPPILHVDNHLGQLTTTFLGKYTVGTGVMASGAAGASEGYATLLDATTALGKLSLGADKGAIAVIAQDGRYYGEHVVTNGENGGKAGVAINFETPMPDLGRTFVGNDPNVAALVDGLQILQSASVFAQGNGGAPAA
jgi:hypothetical protein